MIYLTKNYEKENKMENLQITNPHTIVILATGGTISGSGEVGKTTNYTPGSISVDALITNIPLLQSIAPIATVQICNVNSDDIGTPELLHLVSTINDLARNPMVDGFVITHGSDTLEETAYFLHLTIKTIKPVVLVGSMRPATALSPDGPMNIYNGVVLASHAPHSRGVLVTLGDGIYGARDVQKITTLTPSAFSQGYLGALGYFVDGVPYFYQSSIKPHTMESPFYMEGTVTLPKVEIVSFYTDANPEIIPWLSERCQGLVIAGAGAGEYSLAFKEEIDKLGEAGFPIIRSSRVPNCLVTPNPKYDTSQWILPSGNLSPQKSRILLQLGLNLWKDALTLRELFKKY